MTKRILLTATTLAVMALAVPAFAQDYNWTGFYIGGNLGGGWGDTSISTTVAAGNGTTVIPPADVARINQTGSSDGNKTGFTGGVQAGYNYASENWLFGIETDFGALDINQQRSNTYQAAVAISLPISPTPVFPTYALDQRVETGWIWTIRPRIGYVSGPWLFYGTAGMAMSDIKLTTKYADTRSPPNTASFSHSKTKTGWTAGLGAAYMFTPNWSVRGEWLYADFGHVHDTFATTNGFVGLRSESKVRANLLRVGVDYKF